MNLNPHDLHLFHHPKDQLRLTLGEEKSYPVVTPAWAAPMSHPNRNLALLNGKGEEIAMVETLEELSETSRRAIEIELQRRYLAPQITQILHAKVEFGATYWSVQTERGQRDLVTQSLQENAQWLGPQHLLLVDIDGNRFEIPRVDKLDAKSRQYIETIL